MRTTHSALGIVTAAATVVAMAFAAGCGSSSSSDDAVADAPAASQSDDTTADEPVDDPADAEQAPADETGDAADPGAPDGTGQTLNVWMQGDTLTDIDIDALNAEFEDATGATVNLQEQTWGDYATKVLTGLADTTDDAPDVLELGNTQVAGFADQLATLDKSAFDNNDTWLQGLEEAGTYNGDFVAVPYYAGVRVGIINTAMADAAGVATEFDSLADLQAGAAALLADHGDDGSFSGLLFPSRYWYEGMSFIWDFGGEIAIGSDADGWTGGLSSAESQAGVQALKDLYDAASRNAGNTDEGEDAAIMAAELTAIIVDPTWMPGVVASEDNGNPEIADSLAMFVMPSHQAGAVMPQFLGGSNIGINAQSTKQELANYYVQLLTGTTYQSNLAAAGYITNTTSIEPSEAGALATRAASTGRFIPNSKNWTQVEDAAVLADFFDDVLANGVPIADAAADADAKLEKLLNG